MGKFKNYHGLSDFQSDLEIFGVKLLLCMSKVFNIATAF